MVIDDLKTVKYRLSNQANRCHSITIVDGQTQKAQNTNGKVFQNRQVNQMHIYTYAHNLAPLLHILPHGVDDVTAHVLPSSAFLPHPDQTHPVRAEQSRTLTQDSLTSACVTPRSVRICVTRKLQRSARQHTHIKEMSGLNRQHLWPDVDYHRNSFLQTEGRIEIIFCGTWFSIVFPHFYI